MIMCLRDISLYEEHNAVSTGRRNLINLSYCFYVFFVCYSFL